MARIHLPCFETQQKQSGRIEMQGADQECAQSSALRKDALQHAAQELEALELASAEALAGLERLIERQHQEVRSH